MQETIRRGYRKMDRRRNRWLLLTMIIVSLVGVSARAEQPARFVARLQDGQVIEGQTLSDWHAADTAPKLDNQPLLSEANPFRWLLDRLHAPPPCPESFVEMVSGDRVPGIVEAYRTGMESTFDPLPPHLVVRYVGTNVVNLEPQTTLLRVDIRFVRRIVWRKRRSGASPERTASLAAGGEVPFRSIRFGAREVTLLTDRGLRRVAYQDLAELPLPAVDYWAAYLDELVQLTPNGRGRLTQVETVDGLVATTSLERWLPRAVGDAREMNRWVHGLQPAWSLDVLWVLPRDIWVRRAWSGAEVPLSRVPPARAVQRSLLGDVTYPVQTNRNAAGGPLRTAQAESGWGLGVHAFAELEYQLPSWARSLRSEFAIDASMREGGCVRPRVLNVEANMAPLYEGPVLVGSANVVDTGHIGLPDGGDRPRRVVLQVDPVATDRPSGADPFDIRDHANWLEPSVQLDADQLSQRLAQRTTTLGRGWSDGKVVLEEGGQWRWRNFFASAPGNLGEFQAVVSVTGKPLKLTLERRLDSAHRWLVVDAMRCEPSQPPVRVSVRWGDAAATEHDLPVYDPNRIDYRPIVLPLASSSASDSAVQSVEVRQLPATGDAFVWWRKITLTEQHPLLHTLFEDDLAKAVPGEDRSATILDRELKYSGTASVKLSARQTARLPLDRRVSIRERPQLGEFRFLRMALRKQGGGGLRVVLDLPAAEKAAVYEAGAKPPSDPGVKRLSTRDLSDEWFIVTRDLYSDFGNMDLAGLTLHCLDGQAVWIDQVYLARTQGDFALIKQVLGSPQP